MDTKKGVVLLELLSELCSYTKECMHQFFGAAYWTNKSVRISVLRCNLTRL
jgi:hypothetical protein